MEITGDTLKQHLESQREIVTNNIKNIDNARNSGSSIDIEHLKNNFQTSVTEFVALALEAKANSPS